MKEQIAIQSALRSQFNSYQQKNPAFSLRAYAQKLKLSPSALSEILSGKRKISKKMAYKIMDHMLLDQKEVIRIKSIFENANHQSQQVNEINTSPVLNKYKNKINFLKLSSDKFSFISEWQHFALLSLMETVHFKSDLHWISKRLQISKLKAQKTLKRLLDLNLITQKKNHFQTTQKQLMTSDDVVNQAVRKSHYEDLKLAEKALDHCPVELRDFTAVTLAVDKSKIQEAKNMIREFQDALTQFLEDGEKTEVYKLTFYMYPLTQTEPLKKGETHEK